MNRHMTRAKREKLAYAAVSRETYIAGFRAGFQSERACSRLIDERIISLALERDAARQELAELKARYKSMSACYECQFYNHECASPEWCSSWIAEE